MERRIETITLDEEEDVCVRGLTQLSRCEIGQIGALLYCGLRNLKYKKDKEIHEKYGKVLAAIYSNSELTIQQIKEEINYWFKQLLTTAQWEKLSWRKIARSSNCHDLLVSINERRLWEEKQRLEIVP